jgi:hypothetical protein
LIGEIKNSINKSLDDPRMEFIGAEDEARTRDLNLGKVALYQLSYFRVLSPLNSLGLQK